MDEKRRAAWEAAFVKLDRDEQVPSEDHNALFRLGMFDGLNKTDRKEEAMNVVRYWLHGFDLSPISPRGSAEAENWFTFKRNMLRAMIEVDTDELNRLEEKLRVMMKTGADPLNFGEAIVEELLAEKLRAMIKTITDENDHWEAKNEERQAEKLRAMIEASTHDYDYWVALNVIAIRLHADGQVFPDDLADWAMEIHRQNVEGDLNRPPKPNSNEGEPRYARDSRNYMFAYVFNLLEFLGLRGIGERHDAISEVCEVSPRTVQDGIKKGMALDGKLPKPWECWPHKS